MKRDMDLIRAILLALADMPSEGSALSKLDGVDKRLFDEHVLWLQEAGLIEAKISQDGLKKVTVAIALRLTWSGCEFADSVRSDTLWAKAKATVLKPAGSWTFSILGDWLKTELLTSIGKIGG